MVKYEKICQLEKSGELRECIDLGIIPITTAFHKLVFECWMRYREDIESTMMVYLLTSEDMGISESQVRNIVKDFQR